MLSGNELTSEYFHSVALTICQPKKGYRYGADSLALADFCRDCGGLRIAEPCSGCGVISCVIAARDKPKYVAAVEIQKELHAVAQKNVSTNNLDRIIRCINADCRIFAQENKECFDAIVSNPPFHKKAAGRLSTNPQRAAARHEMNGTLFDFLESSKMLLVRNGRLLLVFASERRDELYSLAGNCGFELLRYENKASIFFAEFRKL